MAITTEADAEKKGTEMGRKYIVPYGLYRVEGKSDCPRDALNICRMLSLKPEILEKIEQAY